MDLARVNANNIFFTYSAVPHTRNSCIFIGCCYMRSCNTTYQLQPQHGSS